MRPLSEFMTSHSTALEQQLQLKAYEQQDVNDNFNEELENRFL